MQPSKLIQLIESLVKEIANVPPEHQGKQLLADTDNTGMTINGAQAEQLASVLNSLGVDSETVLKPEEEEVPDLTEKSTPGASKSIKSKVAKTSKSKKAESVKVDIDQSAIDAAAQFYEIGKQGANWYFEANASLKGFPDEQDKVLFAILLASTSVQNEIYTNFVEAAGMYNAIKKDMKENIDLLRAFVLDQQVNLSDPKILDNPQYTNLSLFQVPKISKITMISSKMGNIKRALVLYLDGKLTKEVVRNVIAASIKPGKVQFLRRDPLIQRLKIANYALTLVDPEFASSKNNWFNVVVDTWMFRIFYPQYGKSKVMIDKLFGSEVAYMKVAQVVSDLAAKAGVSPHVMQAALWVGIKRTWEGETANEANYVSAMKRLINEYGQFWDDIEKETENLAAVIAKLDATTVAQVLANKRKETGIALGAKAKERFAKIRADKLAAQQSKTPVPVAKGK